MKKQFGLIGFPLGHSFSKGYFTEKFQNLGLAESHAYDTCELEHIENLQALVAQNPDLCGLNVTIPHKKAVIPFLDGLDASAERIGAVNVICINPDKKLIGYNSDYFGFKQSLTNWIKPYLNSDISHLTSLVLGNGGAAQAVIVALQDLKIPYQVVTRKGDGDILFDDLNQEIIEKHQLIINTTPLGTYPKTENFPSIPYQFLTEKHFLYDLVYNPTETTFMKKGLERGANVKNGYEMLILQAEKAWEIWNQ